MDVPKWEPPADASEQVESALRVIESLLDIKEDLTERMLRRFLTNCLWQLTEAQGRTKYAIRFWTQGALDLVEKQHLRPGQYGEFLQHEHVHRRNDMVRKLIARPADARRIAHRAIGCVVTRDEHQRLEVADRQKPKVDGWRRCNWAGLVVIDRKTGRERRSPRNS